MADLPLKDDKRDESLSQNEDDVGFGQVEIINASGETVKAFFPQDMANKK